LGGWNVEFGAEGAFNRLRSDGDLFALDAAGGRTRIDLPVDQAVVRERRAEIFVNVGRPLSSTLRLDAGATYETSRLTVSGDAMAQRSLSFLKPKATLDWRPAGGWHAQLAVARTVAQLDFGDFIGAAELTSERINGGTVTLVPQRVWTVEGTIERPILGDGQAKLQAGYQFYSLVQDRVPTPEGFDAPGNLGDGTLRFVRATLDAPLTRLGIRGGRLTINGTVRHSSVLDPYTLTRRPFSNLVRWEMEARFRQDLGQFAWGVSYFGFPRNTVYRRNEIDRANGLEPFVAVFVEYRPNSRTTLAASVDNVFDRPFTRSRLFFAPDRSNLVPSVLEFRERNVHPTIRLAIKQTLG
jgi:outer membrane receptor protein involved in Fe transport